MLWRMKGKKLKRMPQNNWITGKSTPKKESSIPVINNITTNLEISNHQKNSLIYLMDNVDRIKAILDLSLIHIFHNLKI